MVKKIMILSLMLMAASTHPMQLIVSKALDCMRYASMALHPWNTARDIYVNATKIEEQANLLQQKGIINFVDTETVQMVHDITGDTSIRVVEWPDCESEGMAVKDIVTGIKGMVLHPGVLRALKGTNKPKTADEFDTYVIDRFNELQEKYQTTGATQLTISGEDAQALQHDLVSELRNSLMKSEGVMIVKHENAHLKHFDSRRKCILSIAQPFGYAAFDKGLRMVSNKIAPRLVNKVPILVRKGLFGGLLAYGYIKAGPLVTAVISRETERQADYGAIIESDIETLHGGVSFFSKVDRIQHVFDPENHIQKPYDTHPTRFSRLQSYEDALARKEEIEKHNKHNEEQA
jgi:hypothetical protein